MQAPINMRNQPLQQNMHSNVSNDGLLNDDPYSNLPNHPPRAAIMQNKILRIPPTQKRGMSSQGNRIPPAYFQQQKRAQSKRAPVRGQPQDYQQPPMSSQVTGDMINFLKEELLQTWDSFLIPDYHRAVFLDCIYGLHPSQYLPLLAKEIEDLKQEQAPIQSAVRSIIARESCIQQTRELDKVLHDEQTVAGQELLEECVQVLHSLRMLSLHAVKCIIEWRKQLVYSYLVTTSSGSAGQERNSINKFKNIPFIWEGENYLLKMKSDTSFLFHSEFSKFFNFSAKSDPFLV